MTDEERLQSVIGSFAIEGIELTEENIEMGKDILSGKRTIDECIAELYKKYGIRPDDKSEVKNLADWDPDFIKLTPEEKEHMRKNEEEMAEGIFYTEEEVWND